MVPVKCVPTIVTLVPGPPLDGEKLETVGAAVESTVKDSGEEPVPPTDTTLICEVPAPAGTVAVIVVSFTTVKLAVVIPNSTEEVPVNPEPAIVTVAPGAPLRGVKLETTGGGSTVKEATESAAPTVFVTVIGPLAAPDGT